MVDVNIDEDLLNRVIDNLESAGNEIVGEAGTQLRQSITFADDALAERVAQIANETNTILDARITQAVSETNTALAARINQTNDVLAARITQTNDAIEDRIDQVRTNVIEPTITRLDTFVDDLKRQLVRGAIVVLDLVALGVLFFFLWATTPVSTTQLIIALVVLGVFFAGSAVLLLSNRAINRLLGLGP